MVIAARLDNPINTTVSVTASGTAYTFTNSSAALDFGTTDPSITLTAGTWLIVARVNLEYNGATFAASRTATVKLRRTNNTAADLGSASTFKTAIVTLLSCTADSQTMSVIYTTTNNNDTITLFGDIGTLPSAGSLQATEAQITATRIA